VVTVVGKDVGANAEEAKIILYKRRRGDRDDLERNRVWRAAIAMVVVVADSRRWSTRAKKDIKNK